MKKRILTTLLALTVAGSMLAGCSGKAPEAAKEPEPAVEEEAPKEEVKEEAKEIIKDAGVILYDEDLDKASGGKYFRPTRNGRVS